MCMCNWWKGWVLIDTNFAQETEGNLFNLGYFKDTKNSIRCNFKRPVVQDRGNLQAANQLTRATSHKNDMFSHGKCKTTLLKCWGTSLTCLPTGAIGTNVASSLKHISLKCRQNKQSMFQRSENHTIRRMNLSNRVFVFAQIKTEFNEWKLLIKWF